MIGTQSSARPDRHPQPVQLGNRPAPAADTGALDAALPRIERGIAGVLVNAGLAVRAGTATCAAAKLGDWVAASPKTVALANYRAPGLRSGVLLSMPVTLLAAIVERLYGGDGAAAAATAILGTAERRMFDRLTGELAPIIEAAWNGAMGIEAEAVVRCFSVDELEIGTDDLEIVVQSFPSQFGAVELVYPAVAARQLPASVPTVADAPAPDAIWRHRLADALMETRLPVRTVIARPTLPLTRLLSLAPGDIIPVCLPARVPLTAGGRLIAHGTVGEANGRAAIHIDTLEQGRSIDD